MRYQKGFSKLLVFIIAVLLAAIAGWGIWQYQQSQVVAPIVCNPTPLTRQFNNTPYYTGPLIDNHFHMPQMMKISEHPEAPVLDEDISKNDVVCLFDKARVKGVFAFYGIPMHLKGKALKAANDIEKGSPDTVHHFLELVSFPGYPVVPKEIEGVLNSNKDLFKGYGEISLYLPHYSGVKPNDPTMRELYAIAEKHHLIVMIHPLEDQEQAIEEILRDYPNVKFLFHAVERLSWADRFFDTFLDKYPNAYYSVDIHLFGDSPFGRPFLDSFNSKEEFITAFKKSWQSTMDQRVAFWKTRIEEHPDQFLWGTDRGGYRWHYDQEVAAILEEYSRAFIGRLDPSVQEKYAYKNAEFLLQNR